MKSREKSTFSHSDFVKAWMKVWRKGGTINDIALMLGTNRNNVYAKAQFLRFKGVKLPAFSQNLDEKYIKDLNNLIKEGKYNE